jgi:hypothetical protein
MCSHRLATATASPSATASPTPVPRIGPKLGRERPQHGAGKALLLGDLVGALLAHAEELGDLNEA